MKRRWVFGLVGLLVVALIAGGVIFALQDRQLTPEEELVRELEKFQEEEVVTKEEVALPQEEVAPAPTGKIAFVTAGNIHIINPDGTGEVRLTKGRDPVWSPDGKKIAFNLEGDLYVINADGTNKIKLAERVDVTIDEYSWSPDGEKIVFALGVFADPEGKEGIYLVNADGSNLVKLVDGCGGAPIFSPDGEKIAFHHGRPGDRYIYVMASDGSGKTRLIEHEVMGWMGGIGEYAVRWSPDGSKIAFIAHHFNLYVADSDGSNEVLISRNALFPRWSPDGKRIAYLEKGAGLFIANADGTGKRQVVAGDIFFPSWSVDGQWLAFVRSDTVYIVRADGSDLTKLVYVGFDGGYTQWSPK